MLCCLGYINGTALNGHESIFACFKQGNGQKIKLLDQRDGKFLRNLNTSQVDSKQKWRTHSYSNIFLIVEFNLSYYKRVHVYQNEVCKRIILFDIEIEAGYLRTFLCEGKNLLLTTSGNCLAVVELKLKETAAITRANFKTLQFNKIGRIGELFWMARGYGETTKVLSFCVAFHGTYMASRVTRRRKIRLSNL